MNGAQNCEVLIRCDANARVGMGHAVRCLALADELTKRDCRVRFALRNSAVGASLAGDAGYTVYEDPEAPGPNDADCGTIWLDSLLDELGITVLVLDIRDSLPLAWLRQLRQRSPALLIVVIDDPSERRLAADLAFYPPTPAALRLTWPDFNGLLRCGWDWVMLRPAFAARTHLGLADTPHTSPPRLLVTMGGSDPAGMTLLAVDALACLPEAFEPVLVLGKAFVHDNVLDQRLAALSRPFTVYRNVTDMAALMRECQLALAAFGVTAYELAACGVPALYLALTPEHADACCGLATAGAAVCLGLAQETTAAAVGDAVRDLLRDPMRCHEISRRAAALIDGRGVVRIAADILAMFTRRETGDSYS
ncbi:MAG TPA: hypothetical protein VN611_18265 [Patescibacteria group bacterium]|nr:hypothetical protein [Patescibacteria group bacterium]